jgi:hypothetical protein
MVVRVRNEWGANNTRNVPDGTIGWELAPGIVYVFFHSRCITFPAGRREPLKKIQSSFLLRFYSRTSCSRNNYNSWPSICHRTPWYRDLQKFIWNGCTDAERESPDLWPMAEPKDPSFLEVDVLWISRAWLEIFFILEDIKSCWGILEIPRMGVLSMWYKHHSLCVYIRSLMASILVGSRDMVHFMFITKMSGIYETLLTTTVCALQMTQPKRSKTVSSLGISADSPPTTYHSHKVRVDNWKLCIHCIVYTSVDLMLVNFR